MKKTLVVLLVVALLFSFAGCASEAAPAEEVKEEPAKVEEAKEEPAKDEPLRIGYTVQSLENSYYVTIVEGMEKAAKEMGIELIVADAAADPSKHVTDIDNFVAQQVDAILISPTDQKAPEDAVKKAQEAGIPVISMNQKVEGSDAFIGTSEYEYGFLGGKIAGDWLNAKEADGSIEEIVAKSGKIEVGVIRYDLIASVIDRGNGLKDGLIETYTGDYEIEFVSEQDAGDADGGYKVAETVLTANPEVSIFICINDSSAMGVYEACLARKEHTIDNTCITGLDALPGALDLVAGDTMFKGTVDIQPSKTGKDGLELAIKVLENGPIEEQIVIDMKTVTAENIGEYIQ